MDTKKLAESNMNSIEEDKQKGNNNKIKIDSSGDEDDLRVFEIKEKQKLDNPIVMKRKKRLDFL